MPSYKKIKELKDSFGFKYSLNVSNSFLRVSHRWQLYNSLISSILRILNNFKIIFRIYFRIKKRANIKSLNHFWIIRIGFTKKRNYLPFINLDNYITNSPFCCVNLKNMPFKDESCQMIYIKHFFRYFHKNLNSLIRSWKKLLIPGGILKMHFNLEKNKNNFEKLRNSLIKNDFYIKYINKLDEEIDGSITINAFKEKIISINNIPLERKKLNDIIIILKQYKDIFANYANIFILGYNSKSIKKHLNQTSIKVKKIQIFDNISNLNKFSENHFDGAIIADFFEYNNYSKNEHIIKEVRRVLKPKANVLVIIPEKKNYYSKFTSQLFDKGIFTRILDENNVEFKWINLNTSFKLIQTCLKNNYNFPLTKKGPKILLLGNYSLRYTFLNNARWDSQARAFEKLGYRVQIIDSRDHSYNYIFKWINYYKPDILWIGGKDGIPFLKRYADFFKYSKIKVVFWLWDIIIPSKFDFKNIIDYMFITSKGEIPLYKKTYNLERIYYMPVAIMPEIIHRNKFIKEKYDVGFSGQLSSTHPYYKERTENLNFIRKNFNVKIFKNLYNNLPEYNSMCKIIFGGTPYFKDLELYASNRPYIAMGGGCCFITNYFKGLERLAENEKHLLWYSNKEDLRFLLEKYINNKSLREEIKRNAERLVREKHNYIIRIKNMLDIMDGKTEDFYGFIR